MVRIEFDDVSEKRQEMLSQSHLKGTLTVDEQSPP